MIMIDVAAIMVMVDAGVGDTGMGSMMVWGREMPGSWLSEMNHILSC
jgi:hypothetical protein